VDESQTVRVSVEEAATLLGIEKGSVKKRIQRGKLRSEKDARGVTWVYVDRSETVKDKSQRQSETASREELVEALRDEVSHLRRESERKDEIIMSLSLANAEMSRTIRAIEAPQEPPGAPSEATPQPGRVAPQPAVQSTQAQESPEMAMPEAGGGPLPRDQQRPTERPWWQFWR
jgi:hypothetical protein